MKYYVVTHITWPDDRRLIAIKDRGLDALNLIPDDYSEEGASTYTPETADFYNVDEFEIDPDEISLPDDPNELWDVLKEHGSQGDNSPWFKPVDEEDILE